METDASTLATCPSCGGGNLDPFYEVGAIPVHSCLMLDTKEEAAVFPRGDLRLAVCHDCGFITNLQFDPRWSVYAPNYEDQQSFSPTFNSFAGRLAQALIARYNLRNKKIVEIGCSKGDFLALLCEAGPNSGVGIDPSAVEGRVRTSAADRLSFLNDCYRDVHTGIEADFICSRHTLEHIQPVRQFIGLIAEAVRRNPGAPVMIEIPDTVRVLKEAAFEDIYYEHCSYFTPGTLAALVRRAGLAVHDLRLEFADQYLIIECGGGITENKTFEIEESVAQTLALVDTFKRKVEAVQTRWQTFLRDKQREGRKVAIWGSGSKCVSFLSTLGLEGSVASIVDINPNRHGKYIPGLARAVEAPDTLKTSKPDTIIVMNGIYEAEITTDVRAMGLNSAIVSL